MKYIEFEGERYDKDEIHELVEKYCDEEKCAKWVDERYDEVKIGTLTFSPSDIVKKLDPIAWGCMMEYDIIDCVAEDILSDFEEFSNGDIIRTIFGTLVIVEEEKDESD